jgi:hypothetical protein
MGDDNPNQPELPFDESDDEADDDEPDDNIQRGEN